MVVYLLDDSVQVKVFYEKKDCSFEDNICVSFHEDCPEEEKIFISEVTNIYLTCNQARQLAQALEKAIAESQKDCKEKGSD